MILKLIVDPDAENDLITAIEWYERQRVGLGRAFELCVDAALAQIQGNPELYGRVFLELRRKSIRRYPFGVFYRIEADQIRIIAILHASRDPKDWMSRS